MKAKVISITKKTKGKQQDAKIIQLNMFRQPQQRETAKLINGVWGAASSSLWFSKSFSEKETEQYRELIAEHFYNGKDQKRNFRELIERICLAKRYVARKRGRYISKPQDYLNIHYPLGLAGTASWLEQVKAVRKDVPEYNKGITTLAKSLLVFIENPSIVTFHRGHKQLMEQNQFDLLQIYNNTILHLQYHS
ncbi:MAG: hypothetical protein K0S33_3726 [Bacteroidetes bacterium]|jgi:hypothetical protein|nr:hypothetical protein [Bacteroidota bacterium]